MGKGASAEKTVREIQRRTRRRFSAEEKIRIVLDELRGTSVQRKSLADCFNKMDSRVARSARP